jgi:hypothetical protein
VDRLACARTLEVDVRIRLLIGLAEQVVDVR